MRQWYQSALMLGLLSAPCGVAMADEAWNIFSLSTGYRQDSLDWNIAGNSAGTSPNVLSELEWRDLDILQLRGEVLSMNANRLYFRGAAGFGLVLDGENQDSDFAGDNRSLEFSRSVNGVDGSSVVDLSGALGRSYAFGEGGRHFIAPLLGLSYHRQQMRMKDGQQVLSDADNAHVLDPGLDPYPVGAIPGLDSSYDAQWWGPWLGMDVQWDLLDKGTAFARLEAHWVEYFGEANWNLRDDLAHPVSFEHETDGSGWVMELGWRNRFSGDGWVWGAGVSLAQWQTNAGVARTYFTDPAPPCNGDCYGETRLNEVNWLSRSINFTLSKDL